MEYSQEFSFRVYAEMSGWIVEGEECCLSGGVVGSGFESEGRLSDRREHDFEGNVGDLMRFEAEGLETEAVQSCVSQNDGIVRTGFEFSDTGIEVTSNFA